MKTFDIELIKPALPFKVANRGVTMPSVKMLLAGKYYEVDYDVFLESYGVNLQRDFVWTTTQKQELILSILKGISIAQFAILVYTPLKGDGDKQVYKIIDGKQRLSAILGFCQNEFPIPCGGELFLFKELPCDIQSFLMRWEGTADMAYSYGDAKISDKGLIQWFRLLNFAGTQQDKEHVEFLTSKL